jgi:hypothetical protein
MGKTINAENTLASDSQSLTRDASTPLHDSQVRRLLVHYFADGDERNMVSVSADQISEFWHDFCQRRGIDDDLRAAGDTRIASYPDYWADRTQWQLLEAITQPRH